MEEFVEHLLARQSRVGLQKHPQGTIEAETKVYRPQSQRPRRWRRSLGILPHNTQRRHPQTGSRKERASQGDRCATRRAPLCARHGSKGSFRNIEGARTRPLGLGNTSSLWARPERSHHSWPIRGRES